MATIKSHTDLEQSRKLAEILPLESADMYIDCTNPYYVQTELRHIERFDSEHHPCWSLAALLSVIPKIINNETLFIETSTALWHIGYRNIYTARADNLVDACYEMIIRLHKLNLL